MPDFPNPRSIDRPPTSEPTGDGEAAGASIDDVPRILVVDDDAANRESLSRRLVRRGFDVEMAEDGARALAAVEAADLAQRPFALILLDVMMPGISGLEVLAKLRETRPATGLPVIMATANDASADVVAALSAGANDYVTKPLDFSVVLARVQTQLELRRRFRQIMSLESRLLQRNDELEAVNAELRKQADQTRRDLELAARVQASFLPRDTSFAERLGVRFAWRYDPCTHVAGDALNVCQLDDEHVGFYVLDVSGHGVAAALTAVSAVRFLAPGHDPDTILVDKIEGGIRLIVEPKDVAARMSRRFTFNADTVQFVTCFYAVLNLRSRELTYVSAGHPGPLLFGRGQRPRSLDATGMPIGIGQAYEQKTLELAPGDRLFVYSDGVSEARKADDDELFGPDRLGETITRSIATNEPLDATLDRVRTAIESWRDGAASTDDVSLLALEIA